MTCHFFFYQLLTASSFDATVTLSERERERERERVTSPSAVPPTPLDAGTLAHVHELSEEFERLAAATRDWDEMEGGGGGGGGAGAGAGGGGGGGGEDAGRLESAQAAQSHMGQGEGSGERARSGGSGGSGGRNEPSAHGLLAVRSRVRVTGLRKANDYNGRLGTHSQTSSRY